MIQHNAAIPQFASINAPLLDRALRHAAARTSNAIAGTAVANQAVVARITMWRQGPLECVLLVEGKRFELQLLEGAEVLNRQQSSSADAAVTLASVWHETRPGAAPSTGATA